ncbi:MAG TPA: rhodanese-like domain-containing protein [Methylomirabilota bacterium]|nr:rhodanese-like domain-containing protein [Methylomirabilota bacterium]
MNARAALASLLVALVALTHSGCAIRPDWRADLEAAGIRFISARELHAMLTRGESLTLIDARDEVHYRRGHLPGAISIPAEDASLRLVDLRRPKRLLRPERLPTDRSQLLVFYCGGPT